MVVLTNDGHCLIDNLRVEKYWGSDRNTKPLKSSPLKSFLAHTGALQVRLL